MWISHYVPLPFQCLHESTSTNSIFNNCHARIQHCIFFFCIKRINKGEATTISRSFYRTMSPANNLVSPPFPTFLDINEKELISIFFKYNLTTFNPMQQCPSLVYFKFGRQMEHSKNTGDYKTILGTTISNKYGIIHVKKMWYVSVFVNLLNFHWYIIQFDIQ